MSLFCAARRSGHLYHKQLSPRFSSQAYRFSSCGIAENCPDSRAAKKSENALCQYVKLSVSLFYILGFGEKLGADISGAKIQNIWVDSRRDAKFHVSTTPLC